MTNPTNEHAEISNSIVALLRSPNCPPELSRQLRAYVAGLFHKADLTRPEIVQAILPFVLAEDEAARTAAAAPPDAPDTADADAIAAATPEAVAAEPAPDVTAAATADVADEIPALAWEEAPTDITAFTDAETRPLPAVPEAVSEQNTAADGDDVLAITPTDMPPPLVNGFDTPLLVTGD
ncbi:MAG: hypothetical protein ACKV2V_31195 [Blastocatellia bacterium]